MRKNKLISLILFSAVISTICMILLYRLLFGLNIKTEGKQITIYIPEGASYNQAIDSVNAHFQISHPKLFRWIAEKKKYPSYIKPGRFIVETDISYVRLINLLRSGRQAPVNVTFNNIRSLADIAGKVGGQIEADSAEIMSLLSNPDNYSGDGFTPENIISLFLPDTYQFFWNSSAEDFYKRMLKEYNKFWNKDRLRKAENIKLTRAEVATLASIVDDEVAKSDEKPRIAGVYINRLTRGIPLQADPTIKFALNDFTITRVLTRHLSVDSPYNTYKYRGLPPGPIRCPSIDGIDAVLNAEKHDYLFFSAKADFSGYHNFSRNLTEHNRYAAEYRRELNKRRIFR